MDFMAAGTTSSLSPLKKILLLPHLFTHVTLTRHREGVCVIAVFLKGLRSKVYCDARLTALI